MKRPRMVNRWHRWPDREGVIATLKREAEAESVTIDWTDALGGETVSKSSWVGDGVTVSGAALSTTSTSANIAGTEGEATNTITTSGGRTLVRKLRFLAPRDEFAAGRDCGD